jgi:hypothetical protein
MTDPRGIRNNNPTNVEYNAGTDWKGLATPPSDGRFCRFTDPKWGLRATIIILRNYQKRGITTLGKMIGTWAPSHENNVVAYVKRVGSDTSLTANSVVDLNNKESTILLLRAMVAVECGPAPKGTANGEWLDFAVYDEAWSLATPLTKSRTAIGSASAVSAAAAQALLTVAQEHVPVAVDVAETVTPIWPEVAKWILIAIIIAGGLTAFYAKWQTKQDTQQ